MVKSRNMTSWRLFVWCFKHRGRWPKRNWEMKIPMIVFIRKHALLLVKSQIRGVTYSFWCLLLMPLFGGVLNMASFPVLFPPFSGLGLGFSTAQKPREVVALFDSPPESCEARPGTTRTTSSKSWWNVLTSALAQSHGFYGCFLASHDSQIISQNPYIYIHIICIYIYIYIYIYIHTYI